MNNLRHWIQHLAVSTLMLMAACSLNAQATSPSEILASFTPVDGQSLIKGAPLSVAASVALNPSLSEDIQFTTTITINKHQYSPFVAVLTRRTPESYVSGSEVMTWKSHVPGPKHLTIRLHAFGTGQTSQNKFEFIDVTRSYSVKCNPTEFWLIRMFHHLFGCCSG